MPKANPLGEATGLHQLVPQDWMAASAVRPLILEDPALVWLHYHGFRYGFQPTKSPYDLLDFISEKSLQFEEKWVQAMAPGAARVCQESYQIELAQKVRQTHELMSQGVPVIVQPALWWAPARIFGAPDLIVRRDWLRTVLPELPEDDGSTMPDHYVVVDMKFTTGLDQKPQELRTCQAQVRLYTYMLGQLQQIMPRHAYLITRDRPLSPLPVPITSRLQGPLDEDLADLRDVFLDIKLRGQDYKPWRDEVVGSNLNHSGHQWSDAKRAIAWERVEGVDPAVLPWIGVDEKRQLARLGFPNLRAMLEVDPAQVPLERCRGLGPAKCRRIRAILAANQRSEPLRPDLDLVPTMRPHEFFVDLEYLSNLNVDFDRQWPRLNGQEMIFMVGVGWAEQDGWHFRTFTAATETVEEERVVLQSFIDFLLQRTGGGLFDPRKAVLYHWSAAEAWQSIKAADRLGLSQDHALRRLPWFDLAKQVALKAPIAVPGAWDYKLKHVARALGRIDPAYDPQWPGDLDQGKQAMVMGWRAYEADRATDTPEMAVLEEYLEADCKALWKILSWMRADSSPPTPQVHFRSNR